MKQNEIIYQIFTRNYSKDGNFKSIKNDLNRIKQLGISIIYLMPIHEIGIKNRKGEYGSPYSIKDYYSISNDLGDLSSFKDLINEIHKLDMKIILDMVFNHTSRDNVLLNNHEEYYYHKDNELANRVGDWSDIIDLDTYRDDTKDYLINVLKYYVDLGIDGFRFDVASMIDFNLFIKARNILGKDIIFIGESIDPNFAHYLKSINFKVTDDNDMYPIFDSLYNYNYYHKFINYIKGEGNLNVLIEEINKDKNNLRLICLENHDNERISSFIDNDKLKNWLDFFSFIKGQIFIYAGQEYGIKHKPLLFEKDPIDWSDLNEDTYKLYIEYINNKKSQKEIIDQHIDLINENTVKVKIKYIDNSLEERIFNLPN